MIAYCEDYERRQRVLSNPKAPPEAREYYAYINTTIDAALTHSLPSLEPTERVAMREDIACRRGATYSPLYQLSPATYKRYKRRAKYVIARDLGLLP